MLKRVSLVFGVAVAAAAVAGAAQAQEVVSWTDYYGYEVGDTGGRQYAAGLWVSLTITDADNILGEDHIYARATFCNESSSPWTGGQRVSEDYPSSSHATLRVPAGSCRNWSEWVRADTTEIHVYVRRAP